MKIKNLLGVAINTLLVLAGLAFIIVPVKHAVTVFQSTPYFSEAENGYMKGAIRDIFYKGNTYHYGPDMTPALDDTINEKADLPAQITPELATKFIMAQAVVSTSIADARFAMTWGVFIVGIFCAIGVVAILLGISLLLMWRELDMVLEGKEPIKEANKETKSKRLIYRDGKPNWKLIAAILAATVLIGAGLGACVNKLAQNFYYVADDGVCDQSVDGLCDLDCPVAPDANADPDCSNSPAQEPRNNATSISTDKTEIITYQPHRDGATQYKIISGDCWEGSLAANRTDAYRCISENQISDPCFILPNEKLLICDVDIITGKGGFLLQSAKSLPKGEFWPNNTLGWAIQIQLADGVICGPIFTGAGFQIYDTNMNEIAGSNWSCGDSTTALETISGNLIPGDVWRANVAKLKYDETKQKWIARSVETMTVSKVWQ